MAAAAEEEASSSSSSSAWSREQDKAFEDALVDYPEDCPDRWEKISAAVGGKTEEDVRCHYELLVEDLEAIGAGQVPLPNYASGSEGSGEHGGGGKKGGYSHGESSGGGKVSKAEQERRKGIAWTEEEHRMFLLGLDSSPELLVRQVKEATKVVGVELAGENALGIYDDSAYSQILTTSRSDVGSGLSAFTYLRMNKNMFEGENWRQFVTFIKSMNEGGRRVILSKSDSSHSDLYVGFITDKNQNMKAGAAI